MGRVGGAVSAGDGAGAEAERVDGEVRLGVKGARGNCATDHGRPALPDVRPVAVSTGKQRSRPSDKTRPASKGRGELRDRPRAARTPRRTSSGSLDRKPGAPEIPTKPPPSTTRPFQEPGFTPTPCLRRVLRSSQKKNGLPSHLHRHRRRLAGREQRRVHLHRRHGHLRHHRPRWSGHSETPWPRCPTIPRPPSPGPSPVEPRPGMNSAPVRCLNAPVTDYDVLRVFCGPSGGYGNELGVVREGSVMPDPDERQVFAGKLGFSETVFVDDPERGVIDIYTPTTRLPFALATPAWARPGSWTSPNWSPPQASWAPASTASSAGSRPSRSGPRPAPSGSTPPPARSTPSPSPRPASGSTPGPGRTSRRAVSAPAPSPAGTTASTRTRRRVRRHCC